MHKGSPLQLQMHCTMTNTVRRVRRAEKRGYLFWELSTNIHLGLLNF